MIKYYEIGNIGAEKNFPNIKAHTDMQNYEFVTADFVTKTTAYANAATKKADGLFLIMNTVAGDLLWDDKTIKKGDCVNLKSLKSLDQKFLEIDGVHITGGLGSVAVGTKLGVGSDGKLIPIPAGSKHTVDVGFSMDGLQFIGVGAGARYRFIANYF